jgi:hypothetical protein
MKDKRKNDRFPLTEDLMFAHHMTHPYCYYGSKAINHSRRGICLASRYEVKSGDTLCLRIIGKRLHSCTSVDGLTCMAEVKWCRSVASSLEPEYRIGLYYLGQVPALFSPNSCSRNKSQPS